MASNHLLAVPAAGAATRGSDLDFDLGFDFCFDWGVDFGGGAGANSIARSWATDWGRSAYLTLRQASIAARKPGRYVPLAASAAGGVRSSLTRSVASSGIW